MTRRASTLNLTDVQRQIDAVIGKTATERAELGAELNGGLRKDPRPEAQRLRACVMTCLLNIPSGQNKAGGFIDSTGKKHPGPNIPPCERHTP